MNNLFSQSPLNQIKPTNLTRPWIFMDAGDTFIYGFPTLYQALQDCWTAENHQIELPALEKAVKQYIKANPRTDITSQEAFTAYFRALYRHVFETLAFPGDIEQTLDKLAALWREGKHLRLFDDAHSAIQLLTDAGFHLGIITNWDNSLEPLLNRLGVKESFEIILSSCQVGYAKPDPAIFHMALNQAGILPTQAWFLGDQPQVDIEPAAQLGIKTICVDYYGKAGNNGMADYLAPNLSMAAIMILMDENQNV